MEDTCVDIICPTRTSRIERSCLRYLPLLWPRQLGAAVEHNDVILTLGLLSKQHIAHNPMSHVSLVLRKLEIFGQVFLGANISFFGMNFGAGYNFGAV
jgi:hypothetical protein